MCYSMYEHSVNSILNHRGEQSYETQNMYKNIAEVYYTHFCWCFLGFEVSER